jgi:hypothetical protein
LNQALLGIAVGVARRLLGGLWYKREGGEHIEHPHERSISDSHRDAQSKSMGRTAMTLADVVKADRLFRLISST